MIIEVARYEWQHVSRTQGVKVQVKLLCGLEQHLGFQAPKLDRKPTRRSKAHGIKT